MQLQVEATRSCEPGNGRHSRPQPPVDSFSDGLRKRMGPLFHCVSVSADCQHADGVNLQRSERAAVEVGEDQASPPILSPHSCR